jgi:signal transduction histidine kinase/predicted negative regulator of RcsB-dependent stress response
MKPINTLSSRFKCILARAICALAITGICTNANGQLPDREAVKEKLSSLQASSPNYQTDTLYIELLLELGFQMRYFKADSLYVLADKALEYSQKTNYAKGECQALIRLGDYYSDKGEYNRAIDYYKKALQLAREIDNTGHLLRTLNNLAGEYAYIGDYAKALSGFLEGIALAEEADHKEMLSIMNENIANLYASQKDYDHSLEFFKKVIKINIEVGNEIDIAETLSNLASLYADMGNMDYAMFNINKGIAIFEKRKIDDWLAFAYEIKGKIYLNQKNYKWALYWYKQSEMIHKKIDDERGKIDLYNGMAEAYLGMKMDSLSQHFAIQAFEISDRIRFMEGMQKCAKTLFTINKNKRNYKVALEYHELFQRLSDTLSRNENKMSLTLLKTKMEYDKQKKALMEKNDEALAKQERFINMTLIALLIFIVVTLLVHRAQKIQKKLNLELKAKKEILEVREKELSENIDTKNKLFSIIGHDLRGPIGALQGILNLFKDKEITNDEFLGFIPKLTDDVNHISFTLNNLLSWGQTQMNGAVTKPATLALETLVVENINLLSEVAKNKTIRIKNEIGANVLVWSDSNQIDIVIRNLISNALKFTPDNGRITLRAEEQKEHWRIAIQDNGVGMDKPTLEKLFSKTSNVTTYGTNNEKGTGLGLSLCKEMLEKNNGKIWVESTPRIGSCFYFTLPKARDKYSKAS